MSDPKPTGRQRVRSERRWGRVLLVLQVEMVGMVSSPLHPERQVSTWWRDATAEDLSVGPVAVTVNRSLPT